MSTRHTYYLTGTLTTKTSLNVHPHGEKAAPRKAIKRTARKYSGLSDNANQELPMVPGSTIKGTLRNRATAAFLELAGHTGLPDVIINKLSSGGTLTAEKAKKIKDDGESTAGDTDEDGSEDGAEEGEIKITASAERMLRNAYPLLSVFGSSTPMMRGLCSFQDAVCNKPTGLDTRGNYSSDAIAKDQDPLAMHHYARRDLAREAYADYGAWDEALLEEHRQKRLFLRDLKAAMAKAARAAKDASGPVVKSIKFATSPTDAKEKVWKTSDIADYNKLVGQSAQQIPSTEYVLPNTDMSFNLTVRDGTERELGVVLLALSTFSRDPRFGGLLLHDWGMVDLNLNVTKVRTTHLNLPGTSSPVESLGSIKVTSGNADLAHNYEASAELDSILTQIAEEFRATKRDKLIADLG
jgi:CRISPR/Cas system CSM-associated protein Csm3 (group 7 of RAMP superfamily)